MKANPAVTFTDEQQKRLVEVTGEIFDLESELGEGEAPKQEKQPKTKKTEPKNNDSEGAPKPEAPKAEIAEGYIVPKGTEHLVHLSIIRGQRFSAETGKEIGKPYTQTFSFGEYRNFKNNADRLGYKIVQVLYNPYNE